MKIDLGLVAQEIEWTVVESFHEFLSKYFKQIFRRCNNPFSKNQEEFNLKGKQANAIYEIPCTMIEHKNEKM